MMSTDPVPAGEDDVVDVLPTMGDSDDIDEAWRSFGPTALRYATVLVGPADAHDVCVAAFLRVTRTCTWSELEHPQRYLSQAVVNEARNWRRSGFRRRRRDVRAVLPAAASDTRPDVDVRRAVASLSVEQRAVLLLAYWEDMTEASIATFLGLSTGTVHRNLVRARDRLREELT